MSFHLLEGAAGLAAAFPAQAIERYTISNMTCVSVQETLRHDGAAILRHSSDRVAGMALYDRYVGSSLHCLSGERAEPASVPASDNPSCIVLKCEPVSAREDIQPRYTDQRGNNDD